MKREDCAKMEVVGMMEVADRMSEAVWMEGGPEVLGGSCQA